MLLIPLISSIIISIIIIISSNSSLDSRAQAVWLLSAALRETAAATEVR